MSRAGNPYDNAQCESSSRVLPLLAPVEAVTGPSVPSQNHEEVRFQSASKSVNLSLFERQQPTSVSACSFYSPHRCRMMIIVETIRLCFSHLESPT